MTRIEGQIARSTTLDLYADITDAPLVRWGKDFLEFDGDLTSEQIEAIWLRMESKDDVDQAKRAELRGALAELPEGDPLRLTICYVLGE